MVKWAYMTVLFFAALLLYVMPVYAQEAVVNTAPIAADTAADPMMPVAAPVGTEPAPAGASAAATPAVTEPLVGGLTQAELLAPFSGTFFLTPLEIVSIQQAMAGRVTSAKTLAKASPQVQVNQIIRISGVVYRAPDDWIVWINGQKVTPGHLLPEMIDINVRDSSAVALKWFDINRGRVIAITLRPQQVYDLTTGILLPGSQ